MNPENERLEHDHAPGRGWPAGLAYRAWKMWFVRGLLGVLLLALVFTVGVLYGSRHAAKSGHDHGDTHASRDGAGEAEQILYWTCSMHPQVKLPKQTPCPICFMDLVPVRAGGNDDADAPRLTLSKRARELARVQTSPVERKRLTHAIQLVGKIVPDETSITQISSYVPGRLDRLFVDYTGILVRKGDHLAEIYSPQLLVAQQEYLIALRTHRQSRAASPDSDGAVEAANAMVEAARRKLELWGIPKDQIKSLAQSGEPSDHMRIDAPLEGWVLERKGFEGMYVETGTPIFTLADLRTVWVLLDAYELDLGHIQPGQEAEFEVEAFPGQVFKGRVSYIDPVLNPATRTVKVRVVVPNEDMKLKPEMFVRARVKVDIGESGAVVNTSLVDKWICPMHPEIVKDTFDTCDKCGMDLEKAESLGYAAEGEPAGPALVVPRTAVLITGTRAVVYVEDEKNGEPVYEGRTVELGPRAGDDYIIKAGVSEGERVVTRGALMIDSALQIQAKPSMMQPPALVTDPEKPAKLEVESHYVADAEYHQHMAPVIQAYLDLTAALATEDADKPVAVAADLRKALTQARPEGLNDDAASLFKERVQAIADGLPKPDQTKVESLRNSLPQLTEALELFLRTFGHNRPEPVVKAYCPMAFNDKGASWFQAGQIIHNAYFAKKMLRCGEVLGTVGQNGDWDEAP